MYHKNLSFTYLLTVIIVASLHSISYHLKCKNSQLGYKFLRCMLYGSELDVSNQQAAHSVVIRTIRRQTETSRDVVNNNSRSDDVKQIACQQKLSRSARPHSLPPVQIRSLSDVHVNRLAVHSVQCAPRFRVSSVRQQSVQQRVHSLRRSRLL